MAVGAPGNPVTREGGVLTKQSFQAEAGSGATVHIITAAQNPNGLYLWTLSLSGKAVAPAGGVGSPGFLVQDIVQDSSGNPYLGVNVGLAAAEVGTDGDSLSQDMKGILIAAGLSLDLVNGGAGGTMALRQAVATAIVSVLS